MNSAVPFPDSASPFTKDVDTPDPIPNVKHLCDIKNIRIEFVLVSESLSLCEHAAI